MKSIREEDWRVILIFAEDQKQQMHRVFEMIIEW